MTKYEVTVKLNDILFEIGNAIDSLTDLERSDQESIGESDIRDWKRGLERVSGDIESYCMDLENELEDEE